MNPKADQLSDAEVHRRATEHMAKNGGSYAEALSSVVRSSASFSEARTARMASDHDHAVDERARAYVAAHGVSYAEALRSVAYSGAAFREALPIYAASAHDHLIDRRARTYASTHGVSYAEALHSVVRSGASFSEASSTPMQIFAVGPRTSNNGRDENFSLSDLQAMAQAYDPALHEAPLVLGTQDDTAPAAGWVKRLEVQGNGLFAYLTQLDPAMDSILQGDPKRGRLVSFYAPSNAGNPVPGVWYLRSISWPDATPLKIKLSGASRG
ncbi:hypothetical protein [Burkholderia anthina]|uniref:hypothetical protein n=1 Tax=Burkholderia anthina TaxID=179879 RepID=UPI001AA04B9D|nr:hypothetical protein [Burkholderia anthina]QTD95630.1 hypothetical protein J4G50_39000 [Burkholderia anthina]QTD95652.1 hypothetical protein J4G50_39130 [Burkholderia anthina]